MDPLLTNALAHEFQRCRDAFARFVGWHSIVLKGNKERKAAVAMYDAYTDFVAHLYEFYLGCIKRNNIVRREIKGQEIDEILNAEVKKLLKIRRDRIIRGHAPAYENHISYYEVEVPDEFGKSFRTVRNIRSHAMAKRSEFDLATFYIKYHRFVFLLFEEPHWLWSIEQFPEHDWLAIERFANAISTS